MWGCQDVNVELIVVHNRKIHIRRQQQQQQQPFNDDDFQFRTQIE